MSINEYKYLTGRLRKILEYLRKGYTLCDVGTDHAYLPIVSCLLGISKNCIATDIHQSPCERATANIRSHNLLDKITVINTDGLTNVKLDEPCDIVIAGMGGETIRDIVLNSEIPKINGTRLVLQPMTKAFDMRRDLGANGFDIISESVVKDDKLYQIICMEYDGESHTWSNEENLLGPVNIRTYTPEIKELISQNLKSQKNILKEKKRHRIACTSEEYLVEKLESILNEHNK